MSIYAKALVILATALLSLPYATDPPDWDAELIFDDFDDTYGGGINRSYTGAIAGYAEEGEYYDGDAGYWYAYSSNSEEKGDALVANPGDVEVTEKNIETAFDSENGWMHFKFQIEANSEFCAIACNILDEGDWCDFSTLTAVSLKAKGDGWIRVFLKSKYIEKNYDWGHIGYVIELSADWETINIPISDLMPAEYSDPYKEDVVWADVMTEIGAFGIEANSNDDGDKAPAEVYIDDIIFKGMKYSDIIVPISVKTSKAANQQNSFNVLNNRITYSAAHPQNVSFSVIDFKGNLVQQITPTANAAGTHSIALPANLTTGNYLVKMNSPKGTATRQLSIIR